MKLVLTHFVDKQTPVGQTSYLFQLNLPKDLPPTVHCKSNKVRTLVASTKYILTAELTGGTPITQDLEVIISRPET